MSELDDLMSGQHIKYARMLLEKATKNGDCLECHLSNVSGGYCKVKDEGVAHRYVYKHLKADPGILLVCHSCDNPRCINLEHLFLGTHHDNALDKMAKGRHGKSTGPGYGATTAVTPARMAEILKLSGEGWSQGQLALKFNVSKKTVWNYINRRERYERVG